jgi:plasminogen activator inhibitor 1 RNA-binding protein
LLPKLEVRRANEGADESLWKDAIKVTKGEEEEAYFAGKAKAAPKARTQKAEKVYIPIEPTFQRPDRPSRGGRGGRGDRGGDRGDRGPRPGRGRGGRDRPPNGNYGGYANSPSNISVDDESAFPSLS